MVCDDERASFATQSRSTIGFEIDDAHCDHDPNEYLPGEMNYVLGSPGPTHLVVVGEVDERKNKQSQQQSTDPEQGK
jgi:hypothetical protein